MLTWTNVKRTTLVVSDGEMFVEAEELETGAWEFSVWSVEDDEDPYVMEFDTFEEGEQSIYESFVQANAGEVKH